MYRVLPCLLLEHFRVLLRGFGLLHLLVISTVPRANM